MKTAEEYLDKWLPKNMDARDSAIAAINDAKKDALLESALLAWQYSGSADKISKELLKMINELK